MDDWFWRTKEVWNTAHTRLQAVILRQKAQADCQRSVDPVFHPGDRVCLSKKDLPSACHAGS